MDRETLPNNLTVQIIDKRKEEEKKKKKGRISAGCSYYGCCLYSFHSIDRQTDR
jgi:hypothetical protein